MPKKKKAKKQNIRSSINFRFLLPFFIGILLLSIDQFSKFLVDAHIPRMDHEAQWFPYKGIGIFEDFLGGIDCSIVHTINRGAAWGLFSGFQHSLMAFRIVCVLALFIYTTWFNRIKIFTLPLLLIVTGAFGNILDFFIYGHVVDMINFNFWGYSYPVFNIADSMIFVGVAALVILSLLQLDQKATQNT